MRYVAPLAGAWIEIVQYEDLDDSGSVAPLAGAWIEIELIKNNEAQAKSLPLRERGLKSYVIPDIRIFAVVAPLAGAWIEIFSLPTRNPP